MSASSVLTALVVKEDGQPGAAIGTSRYRGDKLTHEGCNLIESMIGRMAATGKRTERQAFDLLAGEPWSNGKVWIGELQIGTVED